MAICILFGICMLSFDNISVCGFIHVVCTAPPLLRYAALRSIGHVWSAHYIQVRPVCDAFKCFKQIYSTYFFYLINCRICKKIWNKIWQYGHMAICKIYTNPYFICRICNIIRRIRKTTCNKIWQYATVAICQY